MFFSKKKLLFKIVLNYRRQGSWLNLAAAAIIVNMRWLSLKPAGKCQKRKKTINFGIINTIIEVSVPEVKLF